MKRLISVFLALFLVACGAPQAGANTQILPTLPASTTATPIALTDTPAANVSPQPTGTLSILRLQMIDANVGWAEGGVSSDGMPNPSVISDSGFYLLRTTDGGETWQDVTPPTWFNSSQGYGAGIGLSAIDGNTAWAISSYYPASGTPPYTVVWRTIDGGQAWSPSNPISTVSGSPHQEFIPWLQFIDEKHGWLTLHFQQRIQSADLRYRTSDGGIIWEPISGCYHYDGINGMCPVPQFTDGTVGWMFNEAPLYGEVDPLAPWQIQRTLDGGENWENLVLPPAQKQVTSCNQDIVPVAKGITGIRLDCSDASGQIQSYYYLSGDRGQTWTVLPLPGKAFPIFSAVNVYETFYPGVSTTGNAFFLDLKTGWRLSAMENGYQLERTTDGGETWQTMSNHLDWKEGFQFVDANNGWGVISGSRMQLLCTRDGGKTWQELVPRLLPRDFSKPAIARLEMGYPLVFESLWMIDNSKGWATGANGYLFHTIDGGKKWQDVTPLYGYILAHREFFALDAWQAWTVISAPFFETIWSTDDGGQSWHQMVELPVSNEQYAQITGVQFLNENTGWFEWMDDQGLHLMKTRDKGGTWEEQSIRQPDTQAIDALEFVFLDEKNGFRIEPVGGHMLGEFLSGSPALLSKTTDGGITWQLVDLPPMILNADEISLDKNVYPDGINELMQDSLMCDNSGSSISIPHPNGLVLRAFSPDALGLRVICRGAYRDVYGTYGYSFLLIEYYLSTNGGASWQNWMSVGRDVPSEDDLITTAESEFFLSDGTGWRLSEFFFQTEDGWQSKGNRLLQTTDAGKTWTTLKTVDWNDARFHFINAQEGWAIAKSGDAVSLLHTNDGGKTWEELSPVVAP